MANVVIVSAGLSMPSSTALLGDRIANELGKDKNIYVTRIELKNLAHEMADALLTGFAKPNLAQAFEEIKRSDALVAITPVFSSSYSGLFKTFFDLLEQNALNNKPVLIAATAGTPRHSLMLDYSMRPLFSYLHATVLATGLFAATEDFASPELASRIKRATDELKTHLGPAQSKEVNFGPTLDDEFNSPTDFETLLARVKA